MNEENLEIRKSKISGKGVFAKKDIKKGERICFIEGEEISLRELVNRIDNKSEEAADPLQIDDDLYIDMDELNRCTNHSCDPNAFIRGKNELVALKDIKKDEEITFDYSTTIWEDKDFIRKEFKIEPWTMKCSCASKNCRGIINQFETLPIELQEYYVKNKLVPDFILKKFASKNKPL